MGLSERAIVSLLEAKEYVGAKNDGRLARLEQLVEAASEWCEKWVEGPVKSRAFVEIHDGTGERQLWSQNAPVTAVTKLEQLVDTSPEEWDEIDLADTPVVIVTPGRRRLTFRNAVFVCGVQNWRVTLAAGYGDAGDVLAMPALVKEVCLQAIQQLYEHFDRHKGGVSSITVGGPNGSTTTYLDQVMPKASIDILTRHRKPRG